MRIMRIVNAIPNDHSNETNPDAEPSIAINPRNPHEMVITAFTPTESGNSNGPLFFSSDGGENWSLMFDIPGGETVDQSPGFAKTSSELYMGILRGDNTNLNVLRTADPAAGAAATIETRPPVDQPWVEATTVVSGPDDGKDRLYVGYNGGGSKSATVDICLDALAANPAFNPVQLDPRNPSPNDGYEIRPTAHSDGTVYIAYKSRSSFVGNNSVTDIVVARDDNWGAGGSPFTALTDPSDGKAGRRVATNVPINEGNLGGVRLNNDLNIAVDPTNSDVVYIVWCDNAGPNYTLRVRRSLNRGVDWSGDLLVVNNAALATMTINSRGMVGLFYQQLVANQMETHFRSTTDGTNWDDTLLARTATSPSFTGDYARLVAVGPHFYGVFPAMNTPDPANFFPNGGGTFRFQRNTSGTSLVGTDGTTVISPSVDPFFFKVEEKDVAFILNRNPIGQDEIDARRKQPGGLPIKDAFRVVVDGFTAAELGLTGPGLTLPNLPVIFPATGITISASTPIANTSENGDYGTEIQRFTFYYDIDFSDSTDPAFNFPGLSEDLALNVTAGGVPASAVLTLIKQPDPFLLHGDPSWLSIDLRVFVVRPGDTWFGITVPTGFNASAAPGFIQQVIAALNQPNSTVRGDFDNLPTDESAKLFVHPTDGLSGPLVFNFALAKVHYIGLISSATNVRVFFRLFNAQTTSSAFDYPPGVQYRRATNNSNPSNPQPIPLAGFQGSDYVTIPCFASGRLLNGVGTPPDPTMTGMDKQIDDYNIQTFPAIGAEVDMYFGCWLDINQPFTPVLPMTADPANPDGPFTDPKNPPQSIQQTILKNLHQCLIAEIAFDPTPIPIGKDTSNWDKLAQRNLAWSDVGSAQALSTFEIRPTPSGLPADQMPDELMIDWGNIPSGSSAQIYLPAVNVADILAMAARMYTSHRLVRVDDHTLQCSTGGITYVPIPSGSDINYVGLLSVDLPASVQNGQIFNIVVRQVTNAFGKLPPPPPPSPEITAHSHVTAAVEPSEIEWRSVLGAFQLTIPVKTKEVLLEREEQDLSVLRWIQKAIPVTSRWSPAFQRYVNGIADRVRAFGGNPDNITPSPTGTVTLGNIYGTKFNDKNRNGKRDVGEEGLPGWSIRLVGVDTITMKPVHREEITDANGNYAFMGVNPGIYQVFEMIDASKAKAGWVPTTPVTVPINLKAGETINVNFGNRKIP